MNINIKVLMVVVFNVVFQLTSDWMSLNSSVVTNPFMADKTVSMLRETKRLERHVDITSFLN
jgi:hypothetical protein